VRVVEGGRAEMRGYRARGSGVEMEEEEGGRQE